MIKAKITGTELEISEREPLLAGTVGLNKISLEFSDDWSGLTKQIDFTNEHSGQSRRISAEVGVCTVPWELLRSEGDISCYVRGISAEGKLVLRTNEENLGTVLNTAGDSVPGTGTPTPDVCEATAAKIGQLTRLETGEKTTLVGAINEVKASADSKQDKLVAGDNITIAADGKTISAAGGGSGVFEVAITLGDNEDLLFDCTADKTYAQVKAATQGGKALMRVNMGDSFVMCALTEQGTGASSGKEWMKFMGLFDADYSVAQITVWDDNTWRFELVGYARYNDLFDTQQKLGVISNLTTTDKASIVAAINEIKSSVDGLALPNPLPVASGGTGVTQIRQSIALTGNGVTGLTYTAYHYPFLRLCFVRAYFKLSSELAAATPMKVLTIPEDYLPGYAHALSVYSPAGALSARVSSGSGVQIRCPSKIATTQDIYVTGFWFV